MKEALKAQLARLLQLQTIDDKVKELEAAIAGSPAEARSARAATSRSSSRWSTPSARASRETETWRKQQEEALARERDALKPAQTKLGGSRTGKEFNAATREVDNKRKSIGERETELKKVIEALTSTSSSAGAHDKDVEDLRSHIATEQTGVDAKVSELEAEVAR